MTNPISRCVNVNCLCLLNGQMADSTIKIISSTKASAIAGVNEVSSSNLFRCKKILNHQFFIYSFHFCQLLPTTLLELTVYNLEND